MSMSSVSYPYYASNTWKYSLTAQYSAVKSTLVMESPPSFLYTDSLPHTAQLLQALEPRVLVSKCFNYRKVPFCEEVKKTEIAHLFEHILLEYLCQTQVRKGALHAKFSGLTSWNWNKDARGIFHVVVRGTKTDESSFKTAITRSILLFETILSQHQKISNEITSKQIDLDYLFAPRIRE